MTAATAIPPTADVTMLIRTIRGQRVILAGDLAQVYGVQTKVFNQAIKRNIIRFPTDFAFQLTVAETEALRSQSVTLKQGQHQKYRPWAFTEHGAIMAATVLNTPAAVAMSVYVVRAFVQQRDLIAAHAEIFQRLAEIDKNLLLHDTALRDIYQRLQPLLQPPPDEPRERIGF
jgi:hypothetical protein